MDLIGRYDNILHEISYGYELYIGKSKDYGTEVIEKYTCTYIPGTAYRKKLIDTADIIPQAILQTKRTWKKFKKKKQERKEEKRNKL